MATPSPPAWKSGCVRDALRRLMRWPPAMAIRFGSLRRLAPVSRLFGFDRGLPIDRFYIERFLAAHATDIRGVALEVGDDRYVRRFGGDRVTRVHVTRIEPDPDRTILRADFEHADSLPPDTFDCIVLTQTLQFIFDVRAAVRTLHRALKPGGVVLATVPGISQISRFDMDRWGEHWRFTTLSARRIFEEAFDPSNVAVEAAGNVLAATAFLQGLAADELRREELNHVDDDYQLLITIRGAK